MAHKSWRVYTSTYLYSDNYVKHSRTHIYESKAQILVVCICHVQWKAPPDIVNHSLSAYSQTHYLIMTVRLPAIIRRAKTLCCSFYLFKLVCILFSMYLRHLGVLPTWPCLKVPEINACIPQCDNDESMQECCPFSEYTRV